MAEGNLLFGRRIKQLRHTRKLTQAQLAEIVDLSVNYVSQIETGQAYPSFEIILKLADGLRVDAKELFDFASLTEHNHNRKG